MNYLLCGKEYYLIKNKLDEIIKDSKIDNIISMNFDAFKIQDILNEVCYMDLFNENKLIIVNNFSFKKINEKESNDLIKYLGTKTENVIIFKCIDDTLDNRKSIVKKFNELVTILNFNKLKWGELSSYLYTYISSLGYKINNALVNKIINMCGYNYYSDDNSYIFNEVDKLLLYKMEEKEIIDEDINSVINKDPDCELFDLIGAISKRNKELIFTEFKKVKELNYDQNLICASICKQFRQQLQVKILFDENMNSDDIAIKLKMKSYPVKLLIDTMNVYTYEELTNIIDKLYYVDESLKSDSNIENYKALEQFLLEI